MKKVTTSLVCVLALVLGFGGVAFADDPEGEVQIENVIYAGTGCPPGSAEVVIADDGKSFTLSFNQFVALAGPEVPLSESRKNCTVNVRARASEGFTWGVAAAEFQGFARVAPGGTGLHRTIYFFQGEPDQVAVDHAFASPFIGSWQHEDEFDPEEAPFAPCGAQRSLNINTSLRVTPGNTPRAPFSFVVMRSEQVFELLVKPCPE